MPATVTPNDVAEAVKRFWGQTVALTGLVPGGLWFGAVPESAAVPYASFTVTPGEKMRASNAYLQPHAVQVRVWSDGGPGDAKGIALALAAFDSAGPRLWLAEGRVVDCRPTAGEMARDPLTRQAEDVEVTGGTWEVLVQGGY